MALHDQGVYLLASLEDCLLRKGCEEVGRAAQVHRRNPQGLDEVNERDQETGRKPPVPELGLDKGQQLGGGHVGSYDVKGLTSSG